eukprot:4282914-Amphidinium_carterae.1
MPSQCKSPQILHSSKLVPLKRSGGAVRPIAMAAMPTVFHKIVSGIVMGHALAVTRDVLLPSQFAIGVSNGPAKLAEAVAQHTLDHPSWPVTQLDMSNAYIWFFEATVHFGHHIYSGACFTPLAVLAVVAVW